MKYALLGCLVALLVSCPSSALAASNFKFEGNYAGANKGYPIQEQRVYYFAVAFTGDFSKDEAREAYAWAKKNVRGKGTMTNSSAMPFRTTRNRHMLIGFYNFTEKKGGWLAGTNYGRTIESQPTGGFFNGGTQMNFRGVVRYVSSGMAEPKTSAAWIRRNYTTRGFGLQLGTAVNNDNGDVEVYFTRPK